MRRKSQRFLHPGHHLNCLQSANTMKCVAPRFVRTMVSRVIAFAAAALTTLLGGCGDDGIIARLLLKPGHIIIERRPDAAYEKLFRDYVELCAGSQFRAKLTGEGGIAGHAAMYPNPHSPDDAANLRVFATIRD